jgi:hypothetical protein
MNFHQTSMTQDKIKRPRYPSASYLETGNRSLILTPDEAAFSQASGAEGLATIGGVH